MAGIAKSSEIKKGRATLAACGIFSASVFSSVTVLAEETGNTPEAIISGLGNTVYNILVVAGGSLALVSAAYQLVAGYIAGDSQRRREAKRSLIGIAVALVVLYLLPSILEYLKTTAGSLA